MTTMLDKCAVAGDITQGIDRRGVWTAAITVIGGTSGTAVKLVSSDTVNGEYTDYKTLISAADAETDQYKGFVVDLHGAKKYIKVTGAVMATAVFGDCDHDVKAIAITEGEVPSVADLENNKEVEITENGEIEITPSEGKDGMKKVTATVNVSGGGGSMSQTRPTWTNLGEFDTAMSGSEVIPSGVKVYYLNWHDETANYIVGDGVATLSENFGDYDMKRFCFVASCGDDIAMFFSGQPREEE